MVGDKGLVQEGVFHGPQADPAGGIFKYQGATKSCKRRSAKLPGAAAVPAEATPITTWAAQLSNYICRVL